MPITIDINQLIQLSQNPFLLFWAIFKNGGWIFFALIGIWGLLQIWLVYLRTQYRKQRKFILLAIDVPKDNLQTPKAVEHIFHHLAGAHSKIKFIAKWWDGEIPDSFSLEIISLGGYVQFLIQTEDKYRDLVEAAIYAQYPDAEIIEVEDYARDWRIRFPNDEYDLWGTEIRLAKDEVYPIKTYPEFEHSLTQEFKDPMASLLEAMGKIGPDEQFWLQLVITPADNEWGERAEPIVQKLIGGEVKRKKDWTDRIIDLFLKPLAFLESAISWFTETEPKEKALPQQEIPNLILYLTPGEKIKVEGIQKKISKIGFHTKFRFIYLAQKEIFDKNKASKVLYGAIKQFNDLNLNSFKPDTKTMTGGIDFFKKTRLNLRKNRILAKYKDRAHFLSPGYYGKVLNTEELASVYHFPVMTVKAPLVKKTEAKRAEPPISLPLEEAVTPVEERVAPAGEVTAKKAEAPEDLPVVE